MAKFHITAGGKTEPCGAKLRPCPLGADAHYASLNDAAKANLEKSSALVVAGEKSVARIAILETSLAAVAEMEAQAKARREVLEDPEAYRVWVRDTIASAADADEETLEVLAASPSSFVRHAVARSGNASPNTLARLSQDKVSKVADSARFALSNMPDDVSDAAYEWSEGKAHEFVLDDERWTGGR